MRFSYTLAQVALLPSFALGFGPRGAAERATLYAIYLSEEIFEDEGSRSIATKCVGTRVGFRGQEGRCNILEFVDHLWMQSEGTALDNKKKPVLVDDPQNPGKKIPLRALDEKPDKTKINLSAKALNLGSTDVYKTAQAVNGIKVHEEGKPPRTYTQNLNVGNLLAGATDYYQTMADVGGHAAAAKAEFDKVQGDLKPKESKPIGKWLDQSKMGLDYLYELRIKEDAEYKLKPPVSDPPLRSLSDCFGHPVSTRQHEYAASLKDDGGKLLWDLKAYTEPDLEATVKAYSSQLGGDDAVRTKWQSALQQYYSQPGGATHRAAIVAASQSRAAAGC